MFFFFFLWKILFNEFQNAIENSKFSFCHLIQYLALETDHKRSKSGFATTPLLFHRKKSKLEEIMKYHITIYSFSKPITFQEGTYQFEDQGIPGKVLIEVEQFLPAFFFFIIQ